MIWKPKYQDVLVKNSGLTLAMQMHFLVPCKRLDFYIAVSTENTGDSVVLEIRPLISVVPYGYTGILLQLKNEKS